MTEEQLHKKLKKTQKQLKHVILLAQQQKDSHLKKISSLQQKVQVCFLTDCPYLKILETKSARGDLEVDSIRHNMEIENRSLLKRLNELERRKDELEYLLKMKNPGAIPSSYLQHESVLIVQDIGTLWNKSNEI